MKENLKMVLNKGLALMFDLTNHVMKDIGLIIKCEDMEKLLIMIKVLIKDNSKMDYRKDMGYKNMSNNIDKWIRIQGNFC